MRYKTIADVYEANAKIREGFVSEISGLTEEQQDLVSENGRWTVGGIVEHLAKAEEGMIGICYKLLSKAKEADETNDGSVKLSDNFLSGVKKSEEEQQKFEAPQMVHPEGGIPVAESIEIMQKNRDKLKELKPMFESFDGTKHTFPHPAFGAMTAQDWLVLIGGHEARHLAQINRILAQN